MSDSLIRVAKDGVHLSVHPTCLAAHQAVGWTATADPLDPDDGLTDREINAGLEALGVEPDPTQPTEARLGQRNSGRAARKARAGE